ncbi:MAG: phosphatidylserine decarboxylase family protein [Chthoniobacterales bacterium]|jgi:phosphatidylserine decarboxylase|nr:phosphatidylserine decarboxylase family protein [Chthoniobacterales bacterium]
MRWQTLWQAKWILLILAALTAAAWSWVPWLSTVGAALILFTLSFFRDPRRPIPQGDGLYVSPADGKVSDILEMEESEVAGKRMRRIGIFLSVFDVHVNRAPAAGRVVYTAEHAGTYHDARSPMASTHNAARTWGFDCDGRIIVVRQITGAIARRIVPWAMLGDHLERGQHFGMIRFGSRTEIFLPLEAAVSVAVGDHVEGGASVIAHLPVGQAKADRPKMEAGA